ncbi:MAG: hypothetical protein WCK49_01675 [Myxococcaceae bacterium]
MKNSAKVLLAGVWIFFASSSDASHQFVCDFENTPTTKKMYERRGLVFEDSTPHNEIVSWENLEKNDLVVFRSPNDDWRTQSLVQKKTSVDLTTLPSFFQCTQEVSEQIVAITESYDEVDACLVKTLLESDKLEEYQKSLIVKEFIKLKQESDYFKIDSNSILKIERYSLDWHNPAEAISRYTKKNGEEFYTATRNGNVARLLKDESPQTEL